jgi:hypothetical protein
MFGAGYDPHAAARAAGYDDIYAWAADDFEAARSSLDEPFAAIRATGSWQCLRQGILTLYGVDIDRCGPAEWAALNGRVADRYTRLFDWYREAMEEVGFTALIRPSHPEMHLREAHPEPAAREKAFTHTVLRIDPFLDMHAPSHPRRETLAELTGIDPVDAESWRAFLSRIMDRAAADRCVGTKQLQAYRRPLDFPAVADDTVTWRGDLTPEQARTFEDWVVNACLELTQERRWPHHVHIGTHNLPHSSPLPLADAIRRYRGVDFVLIHCWPYIDEVGYLAKQEPNAFIDTCWQPVLNPGFFRRAMHTWLGYVPLRKMTAGHDSTSIEMAAGSCHFVRRILGEALDARRHELGLAAGELEAAARAIMHGNAVALYGIGRETA